jgi:hypothetical protein
MKNSGFDYTSNLVQLIQATKFSNKDQKFKVGHLGSNAANLLYQYKETLPHDDWSYLVLDGVDFSGADLSGKNFSHTSFHYANLDNVNFTNADFSYCDFTGVRLEEASPVQAIAVSEDENIYALYEDGVIREWKYKRVRTPYPVNLEEIQTPNHVRLIAQPGNDVSLVGNQNLIFYDKENKRLKQRARIDIKSTLKPLNASSNRLLLIEEKDNKKILQLVDLEKQAIVKSMSIRYSNLCDHLGTMAFIIYNNLTQGLYIVDATLQRRETILLAHSDDITSLATCQCKSSLDQYRLALGQADGSVLIFQIDLCQWEVTQILQYHYHERTVNDITFVDENRVLSSGFDKKIVLVQVSKKENGQPKPIEFKLHLQCKGMKINGIKPDEKRQLLEELILKASQVG